MLAAFLLKIILVEEAIRVKKRGGVEDFMAMEASWKDRAENPRWLLEMQV